MESPEFLLAHAHVRDILFGYSLKELRGLEAYFLNHPINDLDYQFLMKKIDAAIGQKLGELNIVYVKRDKGAEKELSQNGKAVLENTEALHRWLGNLP